jgi:hypothetical protein
MKIYESMTEFIGRTPLMRVNWLSGRANILAKLECMNPAGSAKDRPALEMIEDYEKRGLLKAGGTIIEPTSGNTGIALAAICAARMGLGIRSLPRTGLPRCLVARGSRAGAAGVSLPGIRAGIHLPTRNLPRHRAVMIRRLLRSSTRISARFSWV